MTMKEVKEKLNNFVGFPISENTQQRVEKVFKHSIFLFGSLTACYRDIFNEGLLSLESKIEDFERGSR